MVDPDLDRLLVLLGKTYDAALDEGLWEGLAREIADTFRSSSVSLRLRSDRTGKAPLLACTDNILAVDGAAYSNHYWRHDKWANRAAEMAMSKVFMSKELISDEELERSEWYRDWLRKSDVFYIVGAVFPAGEDEKISLGIHRAKQEGDFDEPDKRPVALFLPHLERALQLRRQLQPAGIAGAVALDALERVGIATFVVAENGLILYANRKAEGLVQTADAMVAPGNRLTTLDPRASKHLAVAISAAVTMAAGGPGAIAGSLVVRRPDRFPLTVLVSPFRPAGDGFGAPVPAAIVFVRDPESPTASREALQSLFGLTATEAVVAAGVADGRSLDEIAVNYRITRNTVRTHVKSIFSKTDTSRQPELVALLRGSVVFL